jgi:hypothetical protein
LPDLACSLSVFLGQRGSRSENVVSQTCSVSSCCMGRETDKVRRAREGRLVA